ncbi:hypothetical protein ACQ4PT_062118 [Festuca glaucescens]
MAERKNGGVLALFDVDSTLTAPRKEVTPEMLNFMKQLRGSLKMYLGDDQLKEFINFTLHYIADLDILIKRGTFIEFRSEMINVSPIGRNCSKEERDDFEKYDKCFVTAVVFGGLRPGSNGGWMLPGGGVCAVVANEGRSMGEEEGMRRLSRLGDPSSSSFARGHPRTCSSAPGPGELLLLTSSTCE